MNTNIKTTLCNLLAPITGSNKPGNAQNGALIDSGGNDFNNSEFAAIVRQIKSRQEKSGGTDTPQEDSKDKSQEVLGRQISATLSRMIQNKPIKEQDADVSEIETALAELAALVQANPEQFKDPEALKAAIEEFLPENSEKLQEISDLLTSLQQTLPANSTDTATENSEKTAENTVIAAIPTENAEALMSFNPELPAEIAQSGAATTGDVSQPNVSETTTNTETTGADQAAQTLPLNQDQTQAVETQTQNAAIAAKTVIPRSDLNSATLDRPQPDSQSNTSSQQESKGPSAEQLLEMVQDTESDTAANETPLRQMNLSPEQILAKEAQTQKNPISSGDFKAELDAIEQATPDNTAAGKAETDASPNIFDASPVKSAESSNADIARQIQETITSSYRSDSKQIVVRLDPPELGKVTIQFIEKSDGITGVLQVDQAQTRQDIERALPEIIQNLQNAGVQVKKVEIVSTAQQQGYDTSRDESAFSGQEGGFDRQNNPHSSSQHAGYHEPSGNFENFSGPAQSDMQMTEKSINMLI